MKARLFSLFVGLLAMGQVVLAQDKTYKMHIKLKDGSTYTVKTKDVKEVLFTASQPYDPSDPVKADVDSIHAPKEGGTYQVHITSSVPLSTESGGASNTEIDNIYNRFFNLSSVNLTRTYEGGMLTIKVNPATSRTVGTRKVFLYDDEGTEAFSIPVSQDGDPTASLLSDVGKNYLSAIETCVASSHAYYRAADVSYTGLWQATNVQAPLLANNYVVHELWNAHWQVIARNSPLIQNNVVPLFPMCVVLNAKTYYNLVTLFGAVPYYTVIREDYMDYQPRIAQETIFNSLKEQLEQVICDVDEKVTGYTDDLDKLAFPSKDVARVILADIYMYEGRYAQAKELLTAIVNGGRYTLVDRKNNLEPDCAEIIWSMPTPSITRARGSQEIGISYYNDNLCILQTYGDVLLSLAECENKLGNDQQATTYVSQVATTKGIETTSTETIAKIAEVRSKIQTDFAGYFAFLKRVGLAQSMLGLEEYQLLFPIPMYELDRNPYLTQNPGY
jgi:tetratricopeptide (TPR) repeat protein